MKFLSKGAQNLRSNGRHLGELLAAWWQVLDINALNLSLAERLNHSTLPFFFVSDCVFCGHGFLCSSEMKKREVLSDLRNLGWAHWCHTLIGRLLRVLQDGGSQISILGYFRRGFHRVGKLFRIKLKFQWVAYLCIIILLAKRKNPAILEWSSPLSSIVRKEVLFAILGWFSNRTGTSFDVGL